MTEQEANALLQKYQDGTCTPDELALLQSWYNQQEQELPVSLYGGNAADLQRVWNKAQRNAQPRRKSMRYWPAAAVLLLAAGIGFWTIKKASQPNALALYTYNKTHDIPAGGNKAMLTLPNGKKLNLSGSVYTVSSADVVLNSNEATNTYNTITTPNGGQYQVILPDGSHIYLNAASSLKYPVKFANNERKVTLTGEAYFEITKNPTKPFLVNTATQQVKVLGTHFNINAYTDEKEVKTTLVEGKIAVSLQADASRMSGKGHNLADIVLSPNQQAINTGSSISRIPINVNNEIAWKNGTFAFTNTPIQSVMRQIARWYNVEIDYSTLPNASMDGEGSKDLPLSEILKAIAKTNQITFKIEGRKITLIK